MALPAPGLYQTRAQRLDRLAMLAARERQRLQTQFRKEAARTATTLGRRDALHDKFAPPRTEFKPPVSPTGRFGDRFVDVAGPFTPRTARLRLLATPPTLRELTPAETAQFPALAQALNPPSTFERVGGRALEIAASGMEKAQELANKYPMFGGPFAQTEGPGTSTVERFQTRFGDPLAATLRGSVLAGPLSTEVPSEKRPNVVKAWWGSEEEQQKAQVVLEEAGWATAMALRMVADPSLLIPGIGVTKVKTFTNAVRNVNRLSGPARVRALTALKESDTFRTVARAVQSEVGGVAPELATRRAALFQESRALEIRAQNLTTERFGFGTSLEDGIRRDPEIKGMVDRATQIRNEIADLGTEGGGRAPRQPVEPLPSEGGAVPPGRPPSPPEPPVPPREPPVKTPTGGSPRDEVLGILRAAGQQAPENWIENARLASQEFGERAAKSVQLRDQLIAQGVPEQEAILKSTAALRGEHPFKAVTGLDFTPRQEAWFWDQMMTNAQTAETINVADYMQQMQRHILAGGEAKDFPPFIWRIFRDTFGEDFTGQLKTVMAERVKAVKQVVAESAATRLRKAKPPQGVAYREPLPHEYGAEQLGLRGKPAFGGEVPPARTFAEEQQFRTQMGLLESTPRSPSPGAVPESVAAEQAVFYPEFPAPGATAKQVTPEKKAHIVDYIADSVGILRPILASGDLSWFRQTGKTIGRHPLITKDSLLRGVKAAKSEKSAVEWMAALKAEGEAADGFRVTIQSPDGIREIGLGRLLEDRFMAVPGTPGFSETGIMARPEFYASRTAAALPGVRQSGRAFAVGWNTQFAGVSRDVLSRLMKMNKGVLPQAKVDAALNLVERLLGKGELGQSWFSQALKALGFAPGYRVSGPQAFATLLSPTTPMQVRRIAAEELLTWAMLGNTILTAAKYGTGATVVTAIGASQFGRIKFPGSDTYYNIWGTDNVLARTILQAAFRKRVDVRGNITRIGSGEGPEGYISAAKDALIQYLKSGEDPVVGLITEMFSGETYIGEKLKWTPDSAWKMVRDRLPMISQDIMDVYQTEGPLQTILSLPGAITGTTGITSYEPTRETFRAIPKYQSGDAGIVSNVLGRQAPEPLKLTANEERDLGNFLRDDVKAWIEDMEGKFGPMPKNIPMEKVIQRVGQEKGLSDREIAGVIFLHKASNHPEALNPEWVKYFLQHRDQLKDFYPSVYDADYMQQYEQRAIEQGLIPAR